MGAKAQGKDKKHGGKCRDKLGAVDGDGTPLKEGNESHPIIEGFHAFHKGKIDRGWRRMF
ncbi:MAG: hypothetical protein AAGU05_17090 [Anaerolineaceae bacterium]